MRLIVCCSGFPSVTETYVTGQVLGLERRGHRVTVVAEQLNLDPLSRLPTGIPSGGIFSLGKGGRHPLSGFQSKLNLLAGVLPELPALLRGGVPFTPFLGKGLRWRGVLSLMAHRRAAEIPEADLVHAHFGPTALWAMALAARRRMPLSVTFHGYDATRIPSELGWRAYRPLVEGSVAAFIAHSPFIANQLRLGLGVEALAVPLGVDTSLFAPREGTRSCRGGGPRLAFVGNLIRQKGLRVAIETLVLLRSEHGGERLAASLDVVGEGPEQAPAEALAEILGVRDSVRLHGPLPPEGVAQVLQGSDFLLVPSSRDLSGASEGFGLVSLEAQACGTLVVGTDSGGLPAAIAPPTGGRCVPQQSPSAMAAAVRNLWSDPGLEALRRAARERVLALHAQGAFLEAYERIFQELISANKRGKNLLGEKGGLARPKEFGPSEAFSSGEADTEGSLAAYTAGKSVVEVQRGRETHSLRRFCGARTWTQARLVPAARELAVPRGTFDVVVDVGGTTPQLANLEARSFRPALHPGGIAILGVHLRHSEISALTEDLEKTFRQVLALDALFRPGPVGASRERAGAGEPSMSQAPDSSLRYFLCRV